jgi:hypothetical protein
MKLYFNKILDITSSGGVKCDAENCTYKDDTVSIHDYERYLNKPCPVCGANLLTEEDFITIKVLMFLDKWLGWIRVPSFKPPASCIIHMDGTGLVDIEKTS